jgi:hypothetical protein
VLGTAVRPRRADVPHAVISAEVWHTEWARTLLERLALRTVIADERLSCERVLDTLAAQSVAFVCEELPVSGLAAMTWAARRIEALRRDDPLLGVVFMVEDPRALDPRALGPLVRTLSPGDTDLPGFLAEVQRVRHEYHWELRHRRPGTPPAGEAAAPPARWTGTVPNFNVKHLPYALLSARTRRDVYCEISPQEALLFVADSVGRGPAAAVAEVFASLRQDVDRLNTALGSRLRLHLDHADDHEVVRAACEAGSTRSWSTGPAGRCTRTCCSPTRPRNWPGATASSSRARSAPSTGPGCVSGTRRPRATSPGSSRTPTSIWWGPTWASSTASTTASPPPAGRWPKSA